MNVATMSLLNVLKWKEAAQPQPQVGSFQGKKVTHWSSMVLLAGSVIAVTAAVALFVFKQIALGTLLLSAGFNQSLGAYFLSRFGVYNSLANSAEKFELGAKEMKQENDKLHTENGSLKKNLSDANALQEKTQKDFDRDRQGLNGEIAVLQSTEKNYQKDISSLQQQLDQLKPLEGDVQQFITVFQTLGTAINADDLRSKTLREQLALIKDLLGQVAKESQTFKATEQEFQHSVEDLQSAVETVEKEVGEGSATGASGAASAGGGSAHGTESASVRHAVELDEQVQHHAEELDSSFHSAQEEMEKVTHGFEEMMGELSELEEVTGHSHQHSLEGGEGHEQRDNKHTDTTTSAGNSNAPGAGTELVAAGGSGDNGAN